MTECFKWETKWELSEISWSWSGSWMILCVLFMSMSSLRMLRFVWGMSQYFDDSVIREEGLEQLRERFDGDGDLDICEDALESDLDGGGDPRSESAGEGACDACVCDSGS